MQCAQQDAGAVGGRWSHTVLSNSQGHNAIKRRRAEWAGWGAVVAGERRGYVTNTRGGVACHWLQWQVTAVACANRVSIA